MSRSFPLIMGIVNATPDSFSGDGGLADLGKLAGRAVRMAGQGADVLDLGAASTRPGAARVGVREEWRRLAPLLAAVRRRVRVPLSVDTIRPEIARRALAEGADLVNDISALAGGWEGFPDPKMAKVCADAGATLILTHTAGSPAGGWKPVEYPRGVVEEILAFWRARAEIALDAGMPWGQLWFDPGFGFGKSFADQARMLSSIRSFAEWTAKAESRKSKAESRVLVGLSRKRWAHETAGCRPEESDAASLALAHRAVWGGAGMLRVHNVPATRQMIRMERACGDSGQ